MIGNMRPMFQGITTYAVGLSANLGMSVQPLQVGSYIKINSGAGTLAIVNGQSNITTEGYLVGGTQEVEIPGPLKFWLAATGATMVVAVRTMYSAGLSLQP